MASQPICAPEPIGPKGLRLGVPQALVLDDLDNDVASAFSNSLDRLSQAGAVIEDVACKAWADLPAINAKGGIASAEAYALHLDQIEENGDKYDQRVRNRILTGATQSAADYIRTLDRRKDMIARFVRAAAPFDAFILPTCAAIAPEIAPLDEDEDHYVKTNLRMLRNTAVGNFLDCCAISLPCHEPESAPVGLMLMAPNGCDSHIFAIARAVEHLLRS